MGQNRKKHRINRHIIVYCPESERSEQANERMSGASEWMSEWPSTFVWVFYYSGPLCLKRINVIDGRYKRTLTDVSHSTCHLRTMTTATKMTTIITNTTTKTTTTTMTTAKLALTPTLTPVVMVFSFFIFQLAPRPCDLVFGLRFSGPGLQKARRCFGVKRGGA